MASKQLVLPQLQLQLLLLLHVLLPLPLLQLWLLLRACLHQAMRAAAL
jgi:hypothetical protein